MTFDRAIDPATFDPSDVTLTGPGGVPVTVSAVTPVAGSGNTLFTIAFPDQAQPGGYTLAVGPDIQDTAGNLMDQNQSSVTGEVPGDRFTASFTVIQVFNYTAAAAPFEDFSIVGQPGTFTIHVGTDDAAAAVNLGANSFRFYGAAFTGANQLFVSTNGLITFGTGNTAFDNTDLTAAPAQRAIAVMWDDWINTPAHSAANPMVVGRFEGIGDADPDNDRLVIEWNQVRQIGGTGFQTFQAILQLNTGAAGAITLNYPDLTSGDGFDNGASATVGIKDLGPQGPNRLLISFNSPNPLIGDNRAIRITLA